MEKTQKTKKYKSSANKTAPALKVTKASKKNNLPQQKIRKQKTEHHKAMDERIQKSEEYTNYFIGKQIDKEVIEWHNKIRENPLSIIPLLEQRAQQFDGNIFEVEDPDEPNIMTSEGAQVLLETIEVLKKTEPLLPLKYNVGLALAQRDHCKDIGVKGLSGHNSSTGTSPYERLDYYSDIEGEFGVSQAYGQKNAQEVVLKLLIDDGVPSRGHRKNILSKDIRQIGSYSTSHQLFSYMTAIAYTIKALPNTNAFESIEDEMNMTDLQREKNKTPELITKEEEELKARPLQPILS